MLEISKIYNITGLLNIGIKIIQGYKSLDTIYSIYIKLNDQPEYIVYEGRIDFGNNSFNTYSEARYYQELFYDKIKYINHNICRYLNIPLEDSKYELSGVINELLIHQKNMIPPIGFNAIELWFFTEMYRVISIPTDILEALSIHEDALIENKNIIDIHNKIKKRKRDFYKKHGNFMDKTTAYLESIWNK